MDLDLTIERASGEPVRPHPSRRRRITVTWLGGWAIIGKACFSLTTQVDPASWLWLLLCVVMASTAPGSAWQTGGTVPPANPLGSILNQKPKAPVANQELPAALPEQAAAIPLPDIAARSLGLNQALRDAAAKLPTREQLDQIQASISEIEPDLETKRNEVNTLLAGNPSSLEVREEETFWRDLQAYTANWQQQLSQWANADQVAINMLDAEEPRWAATLEENEGNK